MFTSTTVLQVDAKTIFLKTDAVQIDIRKVVQITRE